MFAKLSSQRAIDLKIGVDNLFIEEYMPHAPESFVKVYLFGLALSSHNIAHDNTIERISKRLLLDTAEIVKAYEYWQEQGLITLLPTTPLSVEYLPVKDQSANFRKKFKKDKYADFNLQLQSMLPNRQIMQAEYLEYYNAIEVLHMTPDAMLSIISYCVRLKGLDIGYRYILAVARNLSKDGILTFDAVNEHLNEIKLYENDISQILKNLKLKRSIDHDDKTLYVKWTKQFGFSLQTILSVAKKLKLKNKNENFRPNLESLDVKLTKYCSINKISEQDIDEFENQYDKMLALAKGIYHNLGQRYDHLNYFVDNYLPKWLDLGFSDEVLLQIASYCFKKNFKTIEMLDDTINKFFKLGLVTKQSLESHLLNLSKVDQQIKDILQAAGQDRTLNSIDRDFYRTWTYNWMLTDELILYAATLANNTTSAISYMNAILADWHQKGIKTVLEAQKIAPKANLKLANQSPQAIQNSKPTTIMTSQELNSLFDSLDADDI